MNKTTIALLAAAFAAGAGAHAGVVTATAGANTVEVMNVSLIKSNPGSALWSLRTCAYETNPTGIRIGEPCWTGSLTDAAMQPLVKSLLDQRAPPSVAK
jgi:hypothetical protein